MRDVGKRVSYHDHTGLIDCAEARRVAAANDNPLGSVQPVTAATIRFRTEQGQMIQTSVKFARQHELSAGDEVEVMYRTDDPADVTEFADIPIFGSGSLRTEAGEASPRVSGEASEAEAATTVSRGTGRHPASRWVGLAALVILALTAFFLVRLAYRLFRRLLQRPDQWERKAGAAKRSAAGNLPVDVPGRKIFGRRAT